MLSLAALTWNLDSLVASAMNAMHAALSGCSCSAHEGFIRMGNLFCRCGQRLLLWEFLLVVRIWFTNSTHQERSRGWRGLLMPLFHLQAVF